MEQVCDWEEFLENTGGDEELFSELVEIYKENCFKQLEDIKNDFAAGDVESLARSSHKFKGTASSVSAKKLFAELRIIENGAKQGELGSLERSVNSLDGLNKEFLDFAEEKIGQG